MLHLVLLVALVVVVAAVVDHVVLDGAVAAKVKALLVAKEAVIVEEVKKDL